MKGLIYFPLVGFVDLNRFFIISNISFQIIKICFHLFLKLYIFSYNFWGAMNTLEEAYSEVDFYQNFTAALKTFTAPASGRP